MEAVSQCSSGRSSTNGLATLPNEIQMMIMQSLPARDVAKLSGVNLHLREMVKKFHMELADDICKRELARLRRTVDNMDPVWVPSWEPQRETALGPHFIACLTDFDRHYRIYHAADHINISCDLARRRDDFRVFAENFMRACDFDMNYNLHQHGQACLWRLAEVLFEYQRAHENGTQSVLRALQRHDSDFFSWAFEEFRSMGVKNWPTTLEDFFMLIDAHDKKPFGQYSKPRPEAVIRRDDFMLYAKLDYPWSLDREWDILDEYDKLVYVVQDAKLLPYAPFRSSVGSCPPWRKTLYLAAVLEETELWLEDAYKMYQKYYQLKVEMHSKTGQLQVTSHPKRDNSGGESESTMSFMQQARSFFRRSSAE